MISDLPPTNQPRLLFTMDVKSLYTIIPNADGLKALRHFLDERPILDPPTDTLIRLAELVLTSNHFEFDDEYYTQVSGVSMGTRMGPSYACLFMGYLEHQFFSTYTGKVPELYTRYIDDCFGATVLKRSELDTFILAMNSFHPSVKYTWEISDVGLPCLDVNIRNEKERIVTSIHYKPTDKHAYLRYDSHHPLKCKNSIPFSQFLRLRRICTEDGEFENECSKMSQFFYERGYPQPVVRDALAKASQISRSESLESQACDSITKIPLVIPYCDVARRIVSIVRRNVRVLADDSDIGGCFDNNIVTAYKNQKNLRQHLVRASLPSDQIPGTFPCARSRCKTCEHVCRDTVVSGPMGGFDVRGSFSCTSKGVIYAITCLNCSMLYIGETSQFLGTRFRQHVNDVCRGRREKSDVATHFNDCCAGDTNQMSIRGLLYVQDTTQRKIREAKLIKSLGTLLPFGMNREDASWKRHSAS